MILQISHVSKSFGSKLILNDINMIINEKERIGLVGTNGAGKTTLLKIAAGVISPDSGEIFKSRELSIGYLSQEEILNYQGTVEEKMLEAFKPQLQMELEIKELEKSLAKPSVIADEAFYQKVSGRYADILEEYRNSEGYSFRANIYSVLNGLNLGSFASRKVASLSGGQKTRVALASLLTLKPSLLILDEPTNYLDLETMDWLEKYLQNYPGAILVVSHDRYFLDKLVKIIFELENGNITRFNANYTNFLVMKAKLVQQRQKENEKTETEKKALREFINKNIARAATSGQAKSRKKKLAALKAQESAADSFKKANFHFEIEEKGGNDVMKVDNLAIGYGGQTICHNVEFEVFRQERVAILGANGIGKTTLLKTILGQLSPLKGSIRFGRHVQPVFYQQEIINIDSSKTVLDELWDAYPQMTENGVRNLLGSFLFSGDDVFKLAVSLSGGEKARLALAKILCCGANLLILDEPTNHLDIYSKEVLEDALLKYPGTLLFVSHDRYFLKKIASRIIELKAEGISQYQGGYDYYLEKKIKASNSCIQETEKMTSKKSAQEEYLRTKESARAARQHQRKKEELEMDIEKLEQNISNLESDLLQPMIYSDHQAAYEKSKELQYSRAKLDLLLEEWIALES